MFTPLLNLRLVHTQLTKATSEIPGHCNISNDMGVSTLVLAGSDRKGVDFLCT